MLVSAVKIIYMFERWPILLQIEYMGEKGTGMGSILYVQSSSITETQKINQGTIQNREE